MNDDCLFIRTHPSTTVVRNGSNVIKSLPATSNALKELSVLKAIKHSQIIKLIDYQVDLEMKLTMPLVSKIPTDLPIEKFYLQCLKILTVLENLKIVHLDFREENLGYDGEKIILLDFGNAVIMRETTLISNENYPPEYVRAPEINSVYISKVDSRVDLWSLGALVYNRIYNYYPTLCNINQLSETKLNNDLRRILALNRPYASQLASQWNINLNEGQINLPFREAKHIDKQEFSKILSQTNDIDSTEAYLMKNHLERTLTIEPSLEKLLRLYASDDVLTIEDLNLFKKLDCQLFSK